MAPLQKNIVLASTSSYRAELLRQVGLAFLVVPPAFKEAHEFSENPRELSLRLASGKAESVAGLYPDSLIIGSDQVADVEGEILGKPGSFEVARAQLETASGKWMTFTTSIVLLDQPEQIRLAETDEFQILFRELSSEQITSYLKTDEPWDRAGSIRAEALGVTLFSETRGKDINTLYGLPLILLTNLFKKLNIDLITRSFIQSG